jgi:hypothetical protein
MSYLLFRRAPSPGLVRVKSVSTPWDFGVERRRLENRSREEGPGNAKDETASGAETSVIYTAREGQLSQAVSRMGSHISAAIISCFPRRVGCTMSERTTEGDVMTEARAATLRVKWEQRATPSPCEHRYLELEGIALGHSADNYYCIVCGECVVRNHHDSLSN